MYRIACTVALGFGLIALVGSSHAQAFPAERVNAHIPFAFQIRGVTLPAGDYSIEQGGWPNQRLLVIRSKNGRHSAFFYVDDVTPTADASKPELVFDRYGKLEFLRSLRVPDEGSAKLSAAPEEVAAARKVAYGTPSSPNAMTRR
jgi:hypothetical protein